MESRRGKQRKTGPYNAHYVLALSDKGWRRIGNREEQRTWAKTSGAQSWQLQLTREAKLWMRMA